MHLAFNNSIYVIYLCCKILVVKSLYTWRFFQVVQKLFLLSYLHALHMHMLHKTNTYSIFNPYEENSYCQPCIENSYHLCSDIAAIGCLNTYAIYTTISSTLPNRCMPCRVNTWSIFKPCAENSYNSSSRTIVIPHFQKLCIRYCDKQHNLDNN
jgi:hypothetical protein